MVALSTLSTLASLAREMAQAGRSAEEAALREAQSALRRPERGIMTTGQAAGRLGVTIPTIKRWIERGALSGGPVGGRWVVSSESVERVRRVRETLVALDAEGNPAPDELVASARSGRSAEEPGGRRAAS
jgi:excisionase family DNA binding protein